MNPKIPKHQKKKQPLNLVLDEVQHFLQNVEHLFLVKKLMVKKLTFVVLFLGMVLALYFGLTLPRWWLTDPTAVKPNTAMPNFYLSDSEMTALIACITNLHRETPP